jgi:hypothetical protein
VSKINSFFFFSVFISFISLNLFADCPELEGDYLCGKVGRELDDSARIRQELQDDGTIFYQIIISDLDGEGETIEAFSEGKNHKFKRKIKRFKVKGNSQGYCGKESLRIELQLSALILKATGTYNISKNGDHLFIDGKTNFLGKEKIVELECQKVLKD